MDAPLSWEEWVEKAEARRRGENPRKPRRRRRTYFWEWPNDEPVSPQRDYALIYRYTFPDGWQYVGITQSSLGNREWTHRQMCSAVGRRLDMGQDPVREVLAVFPLEAGRKTPREAVREEHRQIAAVPPDRRLNLLSPLEDWERNG